MYLYENGQAEMNNSTDRPLSSEQTTIILRQHSGTDGIRPANQLVKVTVVYVNFIAILGNC